MKVIEIQVPDQIAVRLDDLVKEGWFRDEAEIIRIALLEFVRKHQFELQERFQREDIAWALSQKHVKP